MLMRGKKTRALDADSAWSLLLGLAARARRGDPIEGPCAIAADGEPMVELDGGAVVIDPDAPRGWRAPTDRPGPDASAAELLDLYAPLCAGPRSTRLVVGHLGQSLDGRIATESGVSQFITGEENLEHAHRMRALFDAVLVGAKTVELDDPRLTTRRVPGPHPTRVILDPSRRLGTHHAVFADDAAPTVLVCEASAAGGTNTHGKARLLPVEAEGTTLAPRTILSALAREGLGRVFIEGGGHTVSRFLREGSLDRLHVAVAPMIIGSGRPAFSLPSIETLDHALTFECRHFVTGRDVLFDCALGPRREPG
jgi:diaminohydroxyphosphoribosylaminopyrimidine deaminase / 5-amino-6-(5-phosphoribosylamino)uracil reductase